MTKTRNSTDGVRRRLGEVENALVDEWVTGRIDRRTFLQHASRLGIGLPLLGMFAASGAEFAPPGAAAGIAGGVVRAACGYATWGD
jgi:peptide/nickel transport system substrate-binding protein